MSSRTLPRRDRSSADWRRDSLAHGKREVDSNEATFSRLALHIDPAVVLLDDLLHHRQTHSYSDADALGRKARLEDSGQMVFWNPAPGLANSQDHLIVPA